MFERFTDRARRVVVLAQEEARLLRHNYIGTEHILLGLIHEHDGVAAKALDQLGVSLDAVRDRVQSIIGEGADSPGSHIPFTPRSKKVLELSLREALQLGHNYIGTEHILLGLVREGDGVGAQVLMTLGADLSAVRQAVVQQLGGLAGARRGMRFETPPAMGTRVTPAAAKAEVEARRLAAGGPVGSHHLLLAMARQHDSMAAKALEQLGVTAETLQQRLAEIEPAGTSDETPEQAGARRVALRVEGKLVMLEIDDAELAASLEQAMAGRTARVIKGTDPEAEGAGFPNLWSAVARSIEDMTRRLAKVSGQRLMGASATAYWRPPAFDHMASAARYWMVSTAAGTHGYMEVGPGPDREEVRLWLRDWLLDHRSSLGRPAGPQEASGVAVLWLAVDAEGDTYRVMNFGFGPAGPPDSTPLPLEALVDAAVADLSATA